MEEIEAKKRRPNTALRQARIERGWSQEQVAEHLGTNGFTVSRWERGLAVPTPYYRQKLAELFAQPLAALGLLSGEVALDDAAEPEAAGIAPEPTIYQLPPRPRYLVGRAEDVQTLLRALEQGPPGQLYAITGMPGVGKSALAAEVAHQLSSAPGGAGLFPDGIVSVSGGGHAGKAGLVSVLDELLSSFSSAHPSGARQSAQQIVRQARATLANKRALVLLDDLDPGFPLAEARSILLARRQHRQRALVGCTLLITSRLVPSPGLAEAHLALGPLEPSAAIDLLTLLIGHRLPPDEESSAREFAELVGYVPAAIEWAAQAISLGLSAKFLVTHFSHLAQTPTEGEGLHARVAQAVLALPAALQAELARLAPLGTAPFGVEDAALLRQPEMIWRAEASEAVRNVEPALAATAGDLLQLASRSLILPERPASGQFRVPPLVQAVAADLARKQYAETLALAQEHSLHLPDSLQQQVFSALAHAWYSRSYAHVIELAYSLYWKVNRWPARQGEQVLLWGMAASQALHDQFYLTRFLTRLAKSRIYRGDFATAQMIEEEAARLAQPLLRHPTEQALYLLIPWVHLTLIPALQDENEEAERRVRHLLRQSEEAGIGEEVAHAYMKLVFYERVSGKLDQAARNLEIALSLSRGQDENSGRKAEIMLEQARMIGDYEQSVLALRMLLDTFFDPQGKADMLLDQARYALSQQRRDEALFYGLESLKLARKFDAAAIAIRSQELLARLSHE